MSLALLAAFVSALAWSGLDIVRKALTRDFHPAVIATGLSVGLAVLFGGWAAVTWPTLDVAAYVVPALVSTVLSLAIQVSILESVRRAALSRTIPLLSMTPVATALFGLAVLGERPSDRQWVGIALVFVGAVWLGLSRHETPEPTEPRRGFRFDSGAALMLVAAVCISAAAPFDKLAIRASSPALHGFIQSLVSAALLLSYLVWRGQASALAVAFRKRASMTVAALLAFAALGLQLLAYLGVMVGVVETVKRGVGLAASLVAGRLVFGESIAPRTLGSVVLMGIGVTLLLN
jgi:drug/metabolite transporter (DMT)-like permease